METRNIEPDIILELNDIRQELASIKDIFVRRLNDDKQKAKLIDSLAAVSSYSCIEPFLSDIFLLLDRLESRDDEFVTSVYEELYDIIHRRGVDRIEVTEEFDPARQRAVKCIFDSDAEGVRVTKVQRNGYMFSGTVVRPADVIINAPPKNDTG